MKPIEVHPLARFVWEAFDFHSPGAAIDEYNVARKMLPNIHRKRQLQAAQKLALIVLEELGRDGVIVRDTQGWWRKKEAAQ